MGSMRPLTAPSRPRPAAPAPAARPGRWARPVPDGIVAGTYLLVAWWLYRGLWANLGSGYLTSSNQDQTLFEWFFAVQAHALAAGRPALLSGLQNAPVGVNLMANTAMPGLAVPLAPLTLLAGPTATWALLLTGGLAGTATGWYLLFARHLVAGRPAAAVGGACAGFAPPVVSHAFAHPNFTAGFLLPPIVATLLALTRPGGGTARRVRLGALLGGLLAWQVLIGEEPLFVLAVGLAVWTLGWAAVRPRRVLAAARLAWPGMALAGVLAVALAGWPLWVQFTGPASYHSLTHPGGGNDLSAFGALPRLSVGSLVLRPGQWVAPPTEQNAFFGWPLLLALVGAAVWLRRDRTVRVASIAAVVLAALSAGSPLRWHGVSTGVPGPWALLARLPLFDTLLPGRLGLACAPLVGVVLAVACQRAWSGPAPDGARRRRVPRRAGVWTVLLVLAVAPVAPVPFEVGPRAATPAYFTSGSWRADLRPGRAMLTVPPPEPMGADALHWQVESGLGFPLAEGYFVGPAGPDRHGIYGARRPPTSALLGLVGRIGLAVPIGPGELRSARADLARWGVDAVVLPDRAPVALPEDGPGRGRTRLPDEVVRPALATTLTALLGPGRHRGDVWVWTVR